MEAKPTKVIVHQPVIPPSIRWKKILENVKSNEVIGNTVKDMLHDEFQHLRKATHLRKTELCSYLLDLVTFKPKAEVKKQVFIIKIL